MLQVVILLVTQENAMRAGQGKRFVLQLSGYTRSYSFYISLSDSEETQSLEIEVRMLNTSTGSSGGLWLPGGRKILAGEKGQRKRCCGQTLSLGLMGS